MKIKRRVISRVFNRHEYENSAGFMENCSHLRITITVVTKVLKEVLKFGKFDNIEN